MPRLQTRSHDTSPIHTTCICMTGLTFVLNVLSCWTGTERISNDAIVGTMDAALRMIETALLFYRASVQHWVSSSNSLTRRKRRIRSEAILAPFSAMPAHLHFESLLRPLLGRHSLVPEVVPPYSTFVKSPYDLPVTDHHPNPQSSPVCS
jgi:hypothetical protein